MISVTMASYGVDFADALSVSLFDSAKIAWPSSRVKTGANF